MNVPQPAERRLPVGLGHEQFNMRELSKLRAEAAYSEALVPTSRAVTGPWCCSAAAKDA